ncbi:unnamed protein product, partial [Polarella glacialis]
AMAHISSCDLVQPQDQPLCPGTCEVSPRPRTCSHGLPDDVIFKVVELIFDLLLDILSVAVVSRQYSAASSLAAKRLIQRRPPDLKWLLT